MRVKYFWRLILISFPVKLQGCGPEIYRLCSRNLSRARSKEADRSPESDGRYRSIEI